MVEDVRAAEKSLGKVDFNLGGSAGALNFMKSDKKNTNTINLVLLKDIGSPYILEEANEQRLANFITNFIENFEK